MRMQREPTPDERRMSIATKYAGILKCDRARGGCGGEFDTAAQFLSHFEHYDPGKTETKK